MRKHLYPIFAEKWYKGGALYFYSDPHFGDPEMPLIRKDYISDEEQVRRINSKVGKNDTIVFLGDIGDVEYIKKIKGYKVLVCGNHDKGASNYKRSITARYFSPNIPDGSSAEQQLNKRLQEGFKCAGLVINDYGQGLIKYILDNHLFDEVYTGPLMISDRILLSHEPIALPYVFNIHGHDHSNSEKVAPHHFNMCAEHIGYTPVSLKELLHSGIMKEVPDIHRHTIDKKEK